MSMIQFILFLGILIEVLMSIHFIDRPVGIVILYSVVVFTIQSLLPLSYFVKLKQKFLRTLLKIIRVFLWIFYIIIFFSYIQILWLH